MTMDQRYYNDFCSYFEVVNGETIRITKSLKQLEDFYMSVPWLERTEPIRNHFGLSLHNWALLKKRVIRVYGLLYTVLYLTCRELQCDLPQNYPHPNSVKNIEF